MKIYDFSKGFTLIETIVSIGILALGVLAIIAFYANSAGLTRTASNQSIASNLAQGYMDQEMALSYDESLAEPMETVPVGPGPWGDRVSNDPASPYYNFYVYKTIILIDHNLNFTTDDIGLKKVKIIISYNERNKVKDVTLASIKAEK